MDELPSGSTAGSEAQICPVTNSGAQRKIYSQYFSYIRDYQDIATGCSMCNCWDIISKSDVIWKHMQYFVTGKYPYSEIVDQIRKTPLLKRIKLDKIDQSEVGLYVMSNVIECCIDLLVLDMSNLELDDSHLVFNLLVAFPRLMCVSISLPKYRSQECLNILGNCRYLQCLKIIENSSEFDGKVDLTPLADGCPNLMHLDISSLTYTAENLNYLLRRKKNLRSILYSCDDFESESASDLSKCKYLEHVSVIADCHKNPSSNYLREIASLPRLKRLGLLYILDITEYMLIEFFKEIHSHNLVELDLTGYRVITIQLAQAIRTYFPNLRKFILLDTYAIEMGALEELSMLSQLEDLQLRIYPFCSHYLKKLLQFKQLKYLHMKCCTGFRPSHALKLLRNLNLIYLHIDNCFELTDELNNSVNIFESLKEFQFQFHYT